MIEYNAEPVIRQSRPENATCSGCGAAPLTVQHQAHLVDLLRVAEHRIARLERDFDERVLDAIQRYKRTARRGHMLMRPEAAT